VPLFHGQFSVDSTINIAESNFRYTQDARRLYGRAKRQRRQ
jgi:hypothetical protein